MATAPSPASSGTSLVVTAGQGTRFPTAPFNVTIWPAGAQPTPANAEIVRVTAVSTDTLTITRAQESTSARTVVVGDQVAATVTQKMITDIELAAGIPGTGAGQMKIWNGSAWVNSTKLIADETAGIPAFSWTGDISSSGNLGCNTDLTVGGTANITGSLTAGSYVIPYNTFTPTWTSTGTAPAIGNATVNARYFRIGKFVHAAIAITFGSTSTYGTGAYRFALPVALAGGLAFSSSVYLSDSSTGNFVMGVAQIESGTTFSLLYAATYLGAGTGVGAAAPWAWATNDILHVDLMYEVP